MAATFDDVKEFFHQYYSPNNLSLVIAGDFDPAEAKRLVQKYFGDVVLDVEGKSVVAGTR
jgi:zinc protease